MPADHPHMPCLPADVDTVWLRNPVPYMKQVKLGRNYRIHTCLPAQPGVCTGTGHAICTGVLPSAQEAACTMPLQYPDADILTSSDHLSNTVTDEGLELWPQAASAANIGIMLFRPKANALAKVRLHKLQHHRHATVRQHFVHNSVLP